LAGADHPVSDNPKGVFRGIAIFQALPLIRFSALKLAGVPHASVLSCCPVLIFGIPARSDLSSCCLPDWIIWILGASRFRDCLCRVTILFFLVLGR